MADLREHDSMFCRACGNEERASEGYPCRTCGTFICVICNLRGVIQCKACAEKEQGKAQPPAPPAEAPPAPPAKPEIAMPEWLVD
ncbi:MAG: hypothetical protein ABIY52_07535 [Gemmatimonadaceae bacterium]